MGFSKKCTLWDPVFWPLTSKNCVGVSQIFFWPIFLDVFFDVDSGDKEGFDFRPSGAEISPFFWFWPHTGQFFLVNFSKNQKNLSKVHEIWPILFRIFYWIFLIKFFGSILPHLRSRIVWKLFFSLIYYFNTIGIRKYSRDAL